MDKLKIIIKLCEGDDDDKFEGHKSKPFGGGMFDTTPELEQKRHHGGEGPPEDSEMDGTPEFDQQEIQDGIEQTECLDWEVIAKQLLQTISMMDTQTDAAMDGDLSPDEAIKATDQMTSRVLWGKQEEDNPLSSYQNANYGEHTSNGLMMSNPAVSYNKAAYGKDDPDMDGDYDFEEIKQPGENKDSITPEVKENENGFQRSDDTDDEEKGEVSSEGSGKEIPSEGEDSDEKADAKRKRGRPF